MNKHDKKERGLSRKPLADKVVKYSSIPVRVVSATGKEVRLGKGKQPNVLSAEVDDADTSSVSRASQLRPGSSSQQYPKDRTDAYSTYKRIVKGMKYLVGAGSGGLKERDSGSSEGQGSPRSAAAGK